jgi:non-specific serine/threonine protein kinase
VGNPTGEIDVFSSVETLLNSSLLRQVRSVSDEPRFDMLQTIRDYALEKAAGAGTLSEMRWTHCNYFAEVAARELGPEMMGADSAIVLQRLEEEHDNLRIALNWALEHAEGTQAAIAMMLPLAWFWYRYGHLQEGREWTERAVDLTAGLGDSPVRALALVGRTYLTLWSGSLFVAADSGREAVEMSERLGMEELISQAKLGYGTALINRGKDKQAYPHLVDAVELYDQQNNSYFKAVTLVHLANVSLGLGQPDRALQWLDMAMPLAQDSGDVWIMAFAQSNYGEVARAQGNFEKAEGYYQRTGELYAQADAKGDQARLVNTFGYIAQHKGDYQEAEALFRESLADFRELGNQRGMAECLAALAGLAAEQGQHQWAAPLLSAAERQLKAFGGAWWPADRVEIERARERMRGALGEEFETLWAQGQAMGVEEAIAYASRAG